MKDAIDKRNERERIAKSIVKRWNVIYVTKEELEKKRREEERLELQEEERQKADEILKRLQEEAEADEKRKKDEILAILAQKEIEGHISSDTYGTTPMDGVTQEKVEAILSDKERMLQQIIQNTEMASAEPAMEESPREKSKADNAAAETADEAEAEDNTQDVSEKLEQVNQADEEKTPEISE